MDEVPSPASSSPGEFSSLPRFSVPMLISAFVVESDRGFPVDRLMQRVPQLHEEHSRFAA
eukprot:9468430-Ditylum_brightwellii.AAC.1